MTLPRISLRVTLDSGLAAPYGPHQATLAAGPTTGATATNNSGSGPTNGITTMNKSSNGQNTTNGQNMTSGQSWMNA